MVQHFFKVTTFIILSFLYSYQLFSQKNENRAYLIYNKKGKVVSYEKALKEAVKADVIFIGELHNNPISHWLQLEFTQDIFFNDSSRTLSLGAEMFESDNQLIINEYLTGKISKSSFKNEMKLWPNNETDYQPLIEFAKSKKLNFIATNVPRRYASMVYKFGLDTLSSLPNAAKNFIAPLPIEYPEKLACYQDMLAMSGGHGGDKLPKAQAIKDATMAYFITKNYKEGKFIHYNGAYHSNNKEGIIYYLKKLQPKTKILTFTTFEADNIYTVSREDCSLADYTIVVIDNMTKTH